MKNICLLTAAAIILLLAVPLPVNADEEPAKYNFASAQGDKNLQIPAGEQGRGYIYFYNIDGNRITHITLEVSQAPEDWDVRIEPPVSETEVLVSGIPTTVTENLYVAPTELLTEEPDNIPPGMVSINVPGRGYALGKAAEIIITVPEETPLGSTGEIKIAAEAAWLGQTGAAAIKQTRDFDFTVTVVSTETGYSEEIIGPSGQSDISGVPAEATTTLPDEDSPNANKTFMDWLPVVIAVLIVAIFGGILIVRRIARKRRT